MATDAGFAPAKINLALHVTGQRGDGYHLLDSIVVFAGIGDVVHVEAAAGLSLVISGPQAANLPVSDDNLALRAARLIAPGRGAALALHKVLPVASGIGGGSADAAATLRVLSARWGLPMPGTRDLLRLGADVPACVAGHPLRMQGVGEQIATLPPLPEAYLVLINPGVAIATPAAFGGLANKTNPPLPEMPAFADTAGFAAWLRQQRNDLEASALSVAPVIAGVQAALRAQPGCLLARMSGSGATCFGLFARKAQAEDAASRLKSTPGWWVACAAVLS